MEIVIYTFIMLIIGFLLGYIIRDEMLQARIKEIDNLYNKISETNEESKKLFQEARERNTETKAIYEKLNT